MIIDGWLKVPVVSWRDKEQCWSDNAVPKYVRIRSSMISHWEEYEVKPNQAHAAPYEFPVVKLTIRNTPCYATYKNGQPFGEWRELLLALDISQLDKMLDVTSL